MKFNRRKTRQIKLGKVGVGSDFPISVQSMTTTKTKMWNLRSHRFMNLLLMVLIL